MQEYYIRHLGDSARSSGEDRDRLRRALEAAIERRYTEVLLLALFVARSIDPWIDACDGRELKLIHGGLLHCRA